MNDIQKNRIKHLLARMGYVLRSTHSYKKYTDPCNFPEFRQASGNITIFDVGANIGQTSAEFQKQFPGSTIYAFEPFKIPFQQLQANAAPQTKCFNFALSDTIEPERKVAASNHPRCTTNSIAREYDPTADNRHEETIAIKTLDNFVR